MKILAIDTSFDACSAAIVCDGTATWSERRIIGKGHSEILPPMIADGLAATGCSAADFDRIGVVIGPGAFAGIRVGLAFARAFRLGATAVVIGVSSLEALAASVKERRAIAPVFDARRGQVYAALYDASLEPLIEPFVAAPHAAAARLNERAVEFAALGSGAALVAPHLIEGVAILDHRHIDPACVALIAARRAPGGTPPLPLYLRPPDAAPSRGSIFNRTPDA